MSENYIYYIWCIYLLGYKRKMCTTIILWVNVLKKLENYTNEKQNPYGDLDFLKFVYKIVYFQEFTLISFGKWKEKRWGNPPGSRRPRLAHIYMSIGPWWKFAQQILFRHKRKGETSPFKAKIILGWEVTRTAEWVSSVTPSEQAVYFIVFLSLFRKSELVGPPPPPRKD